ncbi:MAG: hypothetical protein AAGF07_03285 [Patescibacteria group bacterium]
MRLVRNLFISCLGFLALFSLFSGLGATINVEAVVTEGYLVENCNDISSGNCGNNKGCVEIEYRTLDVSIITTTNYFCTSGNGNPTHWRLSCDIEEAQIDNCNSGNEQYQQCRQYRNSTTICAIKVNSAGTTQKTVTDNGYTCNATKNGDEVSLSCTEQGKTQVLSQTPCVAYDDGGDLKVNCKPEVIYFSSEDTAATGDQSATVTNWKTGDGRVFKTADGDTIFIGDYGPNGNDVNDVCKSVSQRIPIVSDIFINIPGALKNTLTDTYDCTKHKNLGEFKKELEEDKDRPDAARIVDGLEVNITNQQQLKDCKEVSFSDLTEEQKTKARKVGASESDQLQVCNNGTIVGKKDGENIEAIDGSGNRVTYNATTGGVVTEAIESKDKGLVEKEGSKLLSALFSIVSAILLWFVYFLGWIAVLVLYFLGQIILFFLRTNPAGADFFEVAVAPWTLLISVTNLLILGSFIYVGFGYLLNLKDLKKNVQEFLQSVVIIAIALNFTIVGTATIINITQGIGEIFLYSYAVSREGTSNEDISAALMGSVINSIGRVSVLRCGKQLEAGKQPASQTPADTNTPPAGQTNVPSTECDITKDFGGQIGSLASTSISPITGLFSGKSGQATAALISEALFLIMICVAIVVFWKTAYMAVMRVVGLWLLMITSPIALATYLSPIDALKPMGKKWVDKMVKWSSFYPIFIFALAMVNLLTESFAEINASRQLSVVNDGAARGVSEFTLSLQVILGAVISIGALYAVTNFIDKDFENFAKSAISSVGKYVKPFASAYGTSIGVAGRGLNKATTLIPGVGKKGLFTRAGEFSTRLIEGKKDSSGQTSADKNLKSKNFLRRSLGRAQKIGGGVARAGLFQGLGNAVEFTPYIAQGIAKSPKKLVEGLDRMRQGRAAEFNERALSGLEKRIRSSTDNQTIISMLDGDDDLSRWASQDKNFIKNLEEEADKEGKPSPYAIEMQERILEAGKKAMKTAGKKISPIIARAIAKSVIKDFPTDPNKWDKGQNRIFEQLMNQAADDESLARELFSNQRSIKFAQDKFGNLDAATRAKLAEKEPQLQENSQDRKNAGAEYATNIEKFKNASGRNFADPDIVKGYEEAGGDMKALFEKIQRGYDFQSQEAAQAEVNLAFGNESSEDIKSAVNVANREVGNRFVAEDNLVREQVDLRQDKMTWDKFTKVNNQEIRQEVERRKVAIQNSISNFNNLNAKQQEQAIQNELKNQTVSFNNFSATAQDDMLEHLEAENTIKEFGHDIINDNDFLNSIKSKNFDKLDDTQKIAKRQEYESSSAGQRALQSNDYTNATTEKEQFEVLQREFLIDKYENTHVGQEVIDNLGTQYENAKQEEKLEILQRVVGSKAKAYTNSRSANNNRVKQASMRYASAGKKGTKRAKIHGIAELAIEKAIQDEDWGNTEMFEKVGAARIQNKFDGRSTKGDFAITDLLGSDIQIDQNKNNLFKNTTNEQQRKRDMRELSQALGDYYSSDPNDPGSTQRARDTFNKYGIDLDARFNLYEQIPDPNNQGQFTQRVSRVVTNAELLQEKFRAEGEGHFNEKYIFRNEGPNGAQGDIDFIETKKGFGAARSAFESNKNDKMSDEISKSGGENFASKVSNIFGKFIFK